MDQTSGSPKWKRTDRKALVDRERENMHYELRFCKTMREILLELGIASEIDEYDDYLLEIATTAEKEVTAAQYDRKNLKALLGGDLSTSSSVLALFDKKKFYAEDFKKKHKEYGKELVKLVSNSRVKISYLKSRERGINEQINLISEKNFKLDYEIEALKNKIRALRELGDFEKKPLPDKKNVFAALYDKKNSQGGK
jgi:hypothetical protein